jgi:hypothetical protein
MMRQQLLRIFGKALLTAVVVSTASVISFVVPGGTSTAQAADGYAFDAQLSLTGNCATSAADPIADPGLCPMPPGVAGVDHPALPFTRPEGVATDSFGNIFVSSYGKSAEGGKEGRVDIFDSNGFFISELKVDRGPKALAVDSEGTLYVDEGAQTPGVESRISRYAPTGEYKPEEGKIEYGAGTVVVDEFEPYGFITSTTGIALDPTNDHLFIHYLNHIAEFGSAKEGNPLIDSTIGQGVLEFGKWVAVDAARGRIYASDSDTPLLLPSHVRVFELGGDHELLKTISGCELQGEEFGASQGDLQLAVDEASGDFFVGDLAARSRVYRYSEDYECEEAIEHKFQDAGYSAIAVDNSGESPNQGNLYVTSGETGLGHSYAFSPVTEPDPPLIESAAAGGVAETEAELQARIDSGDAPTHYTFEYTTAADTGFAEATLAGEGDLPAGAEQAPVAARATGLEPGGEYRFRVKATSEAGEDEAEALFGTYPAVGPLGPCPNEALRTGPSAALPDCRAYELVTPADTNGHAPKGAGFTGLFFWRQTVHASPEGDKASFVIEGGALPGFDASGSFNGDNYAATRTAAGWQTEYAGPSGGESQGPLPGSPSPDQGFDFWSTYRSTEGGEEGSAVIDGNFTTYLRYPDGQMELVGRGSLSTDPQVEPKLITQDAAHVIFQTIEFDDHVPVQLEPQAPPDGIEVVYDRTRDPLTGAEVTHVVSLLPGDVTPGEHAGFAGASPDGEGIAFRIGSSLYLRVGNEESFLVAEDAAFAGVAEGGGRAFYVKGGNLFAFDAAAEATIPFTASGDATVVNVADGGARAYFVSPSVLAGANPAGELPAAGGRNLYLSEEGAISFVGTVTDRDVEGEGGPNGLTGGLGLWTESLRGTAGISRDSSRTTPDGGVLLFESRADLTGFASGGKAQVYRYDASGGLACLSCSPTLQQPGGDASLQSIAAVQGAPEPFNARSFVPSLRADGARAFFQSPEPLVAADGDQRQDVYEWEEQGVGGCTRPEGCIYLISSPGSSEDEYLYATSADGDDVFFTSGDRLIGSDSGGAVSIYDARVGGGFAEAPQEACSGEGCRPGTAPAPALAPPVSNVAGPSGNAGARKARKCPKGKRKVKRGGRTVCVKQKKRQHGKARDGSGRRRGR